jgi:hypothetical protein
MARLCCLASTGLDRGNTELNSARRVSEHAVQQYCTRHSVIKVLVARYGLRAADDGSNRSNVLVQ